ncbi:JAB domain-containing protein [Salsipaludibacter albus]|uniref:JAB domain-containing protein n=1 Tax=Salsipaludibacter albus TaxID=2849650 RepID=UPI001EE425DB|nr:JAB domain-containing protein [Salsipaludibacter albus]MBY5163276.1 hypothetical protein [Salsipaludibacter albus]
MTDQMPPDLSQFAQRFTPAGPDVDALTSPNAVAALLSDRLTGRDREHCLLVGVDTRHRPLGVVTVSIGSVSHTFMSPREIYRDAIAMGASAAVVAHNHPSGDPTPSADDIAVTRRLVSAGELMDVPLLDHVVIGDHGFTSLARQGLLSPAKSFEAALYRQRYDQALGSLPETVSHAPTPPAQPAGPSPFAGEPARRRGVSR